MRASLEKEARSKMEGRKGKRKAERKKSNMAKRKKERGKKGVD